MKLNETILVGAQKMKEHLDQNITFVEKEKYRLISDSELKALGLEPEKYPEVLYSLSTIDIAEEGFGITPSDIESIRLEMERAFESWDEDVVYYIGNVKEAQRELDKKLEEEN